MGTNPLVIDISHWQDEPDWQDVKINGTVGVILKATQGTSYEDPTFDKRAAAARQAGLLVSSYHFLTKGNTKKQMDFYLSVVEPGPEERVIIDYEEEAGKPIPPLQELIDAVAYLIDRGCANITIYGGSTLKEQLKGKTSDVLKNHTSLWIAQYTDSKPVWPTQVWQYYSLWQYTDKAKVEGFKKPIDGNKWNGDPDKLPGWFDSSLIADTEEEVHAPDKVVTMSINTPPGVTVQVVLNGTPLE